MTRKQTWMAAIGIAVLSLGVAYAILPMTEARIGCAIAMAMYDSDARIGCLVRAVWHFDAVATAIASAIAIGGMGVAIWLVSGVRDGIGNIVFAMGVVAAALVLGVIGMAMFGVLATPA